MQRYQSKKIGNAGEEIAAQVLGRLGVHMVEEIATPIKIIEKKMFFGQWWYRILWKKKVSADHNGILEDGRRVLAEVKTISDKNLVWTDLKPHQPGRLSMNAEYGGLSLLVWVHNSGVYVMRWPVPGFRKGHGITPAMAEKLNIQSEAELYDTVHTSVS